MMKIFRDYYVLHRLPPYPVCGVVVCKVIKTPREYYTSYVDCLSLPVCGVVVSISIKTPRDYYVLHRLPLLAQFVVWWCVR